MLWEVEILPKGHDPEAARVRSEVALLTHAKPDESWPLVAGAGSCSKASFPARPSNVS